MIKESSWVVGHQRRVVLAMGFEEERRAMANLLEQMGMLVHEVATGDDALFWIEDYGCDLLVLDDQLPDVHPWMLLVQLDEMGTQVRPPAVVFSCKPAYMTLHNVKILVPPVAEARMRSVLLDMLPDSA